MQNDDASSGSRQFPACHRPAGGVAGVSSVQAVVDAAVAEFGHVHSVVSASGTVFGVGALAEAEPAAFQKVIDADVAGFFNIVQATVPVMRERGGSVTAIITCAVNRNMPTDAPNNQI